MPCSIFCFPPVQKSSPPCQVSVQGFWEEHNLSGQETQLLTSTLISKTLTMTHLFTKYVTHVCRVTPTLQRNRKRQKSQEDLSPQRSAIFHKMGMLVSVLVSWFVWWWWLWWWCFITKATECFLVRLQSVKNRCNETHVFYLFLYIGAHSPVMLISCVGQAVLCVSQSHKLWWMCMHASTD